MAGNRKIQVEDDASQPCLACAGPWRVTTTTVEVWDGGQLEPELLVTVTGDCATRCYALGGRQLDLFNATRKKRQERPGWVP